MDGQSATMNVPVTVTGSPPVITLDPLNLASALEIGPTLRLIDGLSPLLTSGPGGVFCVLMPRRCPVDVVAQAAPPAVAVAA